MTRGAILAFTLLTALSTTNSVLAGVVDSDFVARWKLDDTSDSAIGGTRMLTLKDGATLNGGALQLNSDPSNNRAVTSAFNATDSFAVYLDFQLDSIPTGSSDPQYTLLSNVGNDNLRYNSQFAQSAGYQVFVRGSGQNATVSTFQKNGGSFTGAVGSGSLLISNPLDRHRLVAVWERDALNDQFRSTLYLDGTQVSSTSGWGTMNFAIGNATTSLLLGTNVDEAFQPPRTLDGKIYEAGIIDRLLTSEEATLLAADGVSDNTVPEPASLAIFAIGILGLSATRRRHRRRRR